MDNAVLRHHQLPNAVENVDRFDVVGAFDGQNAACY